MASRNQTTLLCSSCVLYCAIHVGCEPLLVGNSGNSCTWCWSVAMTPGWVACDSMPHTPLTAWISLRDSPMAVMSLNVYVNVLASCCRLSVDLKRPFEALMGGSAMSAGMPSSARTAWARRLCSMPSIGGTSMASRLLSRYSSLSMRYSGAAPLPWLHCRHLVLFCLLSCHPLSVYLVLVCISLYLSICLSSFVPTLFLSPVSCLLSPVSCLLPLSL